MMISIQLSSLVIIIGVAIGATLAAVLWIAKVDGHSTNKYLCLVLSAHCLVALAYIVEGETTLSNKHVVTLISLQMGIGPLIFFYTKSMTSVSYQLQRSDLLHFAPAAVMAIIWQVQSSSSLLGFLSPGCFSNNVECEKIYQDRFLHRLGMWISSITYVVLSLRVLNEYRQKIRRVYSALENINLRWLSTIIYNLLILTVFAILLDFRYYYTLDRTLVGGLLLGLGPLILSLLMGWFGLLQKRIDDIESPFQDIGSSIQVTANEEPENVQANRRKYKTSSLTEEQAAGIWSALLEIMNKDKPHLTNQLKISELANELTVSVNHLSETINGHVGQSFYDFINKYRVEEASKLLSDKTKNYMSVTQIGFHSGFNSDSTFFSHFKKTMKITPKKFRKQCQLAEV